MKLTRNILILFAVSEGAAVMGIELCGAKSLAPIFGSTLHVWTITVGITALCLAIGYFLGGKISKKKNSFYPTYILAITSILIAFIPNFANSTLSEIEINTDNYYYYLFLFTFIIVGIPIGLLGLLPPIIISHSVIYFEKQNQRISGNIFAFSTIAGIVSTFLCGFFLIPAYGLINTYLFFSLFTLILPLYHFVKNKQFLIPIFIVSIILLGKLFTNKRPTSKNINILYFNEGILGQIVVADIKYNNSIAEDRIMYVNRIGQTWIDKATLQSRWNYGNYIMAIIGTQPKNSNTLLLGLGGGTIAKYIYENSSTNLDVVEFDQRIVDVSKKYFGNKKIKNITVDDARHYIKNCRKKYRIIVMDIFRGECPAYQTLTQESFDEIKNILEKDGLLIINFNGFLSGETGLPARSIVKTLNASGYEIDIIPTFESEANRNILLVASLNKISLSHSSINLTIGGENQNLDNLVIKDNKKIMEDAYILNDNYPLLEILNKNAALKWRLDYLKYQNNYLNKEGITIIK